jgi:hypothetical protein
MTLVLGSLVAVTGWIFASVAVAAVLGPAIRMRDERSPQR